MNTTISQFTYVTHTIHENGINEFVFHKSSRRAMVIFFEELTKVIDDFDSEGTLLLLIDVTESGLQPLHLAFDKTAQFIRENPHRPKSKIALLYTATPLVSLITNFMEFVGKNDQLQLFTEDRDAALEWLLS